MGKRLRVGVIGTAGRWRRWRSALAGLRGEARVVAVHGPGEEVEQGAVELVRRGDIDAVFLGEAWFGLWPLAHALEVGKPVFCAAPVTVRDDLEGLRGRVSFGYWAALAVATGPFRGVAEPLGRVRALQITQAGRGEWRPAEGAALPCLVAFAESVLGAGVEVRMMGENPLSVQMRHAEGGWSQMGLYTGASAGRCEVVGEAEAGRVMLQLPGRLTWRDGAGRHSRELAVGMGELVALERFLRAVRSGEDMNGLEDMRRALARIRAGSPVG